MRIAIIAATTLAAVAVSAALASAAVRAISIDLSNLAFDDSDDLLD